MNTMSGYTKLFSSILASTIWREDMETRIVWITLLAMAGKDGIAEASIPGLADFARVSVEGTRRALVKLMSPDPDSRTTDHDGRRVEAVDGGWLLLNHAKYRAKLSDIERREYKRLKQAEYRKREGESVARLLTSVDQSGQCNQNVDTVDTKQKQKQKAEKDSQRAADEPPEFGPEPLADAPEAWFFESYPVWFAEERNGARYSPKPVRDFPTVREIVATWPDRAHLEQMARTFLRSTSLEQKWASRTIGMFGHWAPAIDAQLRGAA